MPARSLDEWTGQLRETHPEVLTGTNPGRVTARDRWHPVYLRVYGLRPWEFGRLSMKETEMLTDDLEKHGLGF